MNGPALKAWRMFHGLTRQQFAKQLGVTYMTLYRWETLSRQPNTLGRRALRGTINRIEAAAHRTHAAPVADCPRCEEVPYG